MKHNNICVTGIAEEEESEQGVENLLEEMMIENFPNLVNAKSHKSRKFRESQTSWAQRGLHQDTS